MTVDNKAIANIIGNLIFIALTGVLGWGVKTSFSLTASYWITGYQRSLAVSKMGLHCVPFSFLDRGGDSAL